MIDTCIEALGRVFPLRRCAGDPEAKTCFYGQMGRCAPCLGMGEEEYRRAVVGEMVGLLRGEGGDEHLAVLVRERGRLAGELEFEAAARLRDLILGIERIRLTRAVVAAEGLQAVVAPSTEPGVVEVFALSSGRLVAHRGFGAGDGEGLARFAEDAIREFREDGPTRRAEGADEARVVAAYLRRSRSATFVEAVPLERSEDLAEAVGRVTERTPEADADANVASLA
jgi:excinuclease UvrABC nuclease subunit